MAAQSTAFNWIVERCRLALRIKYHNAATYHAEPLLEKEIDLIRKLRFEDALIQAVDFGDHLFSEKESFHLVGSGGSSVLFYLLGMSEVDPVRYGTYFQRLWLTSNGEPPIMQFVVLPDSRSKGIQISPPPNVTVHPMTSLEAIPAKLEKQFKGVYVTIPDIQTISSLQKGDTEDIFQLESSEIRTLLTQSQPTQIKGIAMVTALHQIGITRREVVDEFLQISKNHLARKQNSDRGIIPEGQERRPIVFQETIMKLLRTRAGLPWEETYRFVLAAAKAKMTDQHDLWKPVLEGLESRCGANGAAVFPKLVAASGWALCKAHHVANAITTYKAVFFRTHHREKFEQVRSQMVPMERGE